MQIAIPASDMITPDLPYCQLADTFSINNRVNDPRPVPTGQAGKEVRIIPLDSIEIDEGLQTRVQLDLDTIDAYAEEMRYGAIFPAIDVYEKDTGGGIRYLLAEGRHRLEAAKCIGVTSITARVHHGNRRDALIHAAGANAKNGLRRTNADKQKTVKMLLNDEELVQWNDSTLGQIAGVHRDTVSRIREELVASCEIRMIEEKKVSRKGIIYLQRRKHKGVNATPKLELQDHDGSSTHPLQAANREDVYEGNSQPESAVRSAIDPQSEGQQGNETLLGERPEATAHNTSVDLEPRRADQGGPRESPDALAADLSEAQDSQVPLLALRNLLDGVASSFSDFRVQYACDGPIVKEALDSVEEGLQRAQHLLESSPQGMEEDGCKLDVEATITPEQPESLCVDVPQNADGGPPTADQAKNSLSSADDSEGGTIEPLQYRHDVMQPSNRLTPKQAAELAGISLEEFQKYKQHGTGPQKLLPDLYYKDDVLIWIEGKRQSESRRRHGQPMPDFTLVVSNGLEAGEL